MTPQKTCLSIFCPERKSLCCGAGSTSGAKGEAHFVCSKCRKEYKGGECTAGMTPDVKQKLVEDPRKTRLKNTMNQIVDNLEVTSRVLFSMTPSTIKQKGICSYCHLPCGDNDSVQCSYCFSSEFNRIDSAIF